jgi:hypothetical protein
MKTTIRKIRIHALITGCSLFLMALSAGYVFGYAFPKIFDFANVNLDNNNESVLLFNLMLFGLVVIFLLDLVVSISLYYFLKATTTN